MSWLIQVFIENTRMSHFFSCHCPHLSAVITRLDWVISSPLPPIFWMPRSSRSMTGWSDNYSTFLLFLPLFLIFFSFGHYPNIIFSLPLSPTSSSLCHYPTWSGNLFAAVANFPDASVKPEHPFITHFLSAVMPRLSLFCHVPAWPGHLPAFPLSPIASPAGSSQTGQSEFGRSAWINCRGRVLSFHSKNHAVFNLTFPRVRPVENRRNTIKSK